MVNYKKLIADTAAAMKSNRELRADFCKRISDLKYKLAELETEVGLLDLLHDQLSESLASLKESDQELEVTLRDQQIASLKEKLPELLKKV